MGELLVFSMVLVLVLGSGMIIAGFVVARQLQRRNRVCPEVRTDAPLGWLWSPRTAARLHRRLRAAVRAARLVVAQQRNRHQPSRLVELATELEREAVAVDAHLALIGRLHPTERRRLAPPVVEHVGRIEHLAGRLSRLHAESHRSNLLSHHPSGLDEMAEQLEQLEIANGELRAIEARHGLRVPR